LAQEGYFGSGFRPYRVIQNYVIVSILSSDYFKFWNAFGTETFFLVVTNNLINFFTLDSRWPFIWDLFCSFSPNFS
jgi:hypothetical protein